MMGVETGIRFMPRPDCNVVNMPNISPAMVGREMMTIEFGDDAVLVHNGSTFAAEQFGTAAETARGLLDQLPEYVKQNQRQSQ